MLLSGSVATDHLMRFPGRFAEQLLPSALDRLSVSFLVEDLVVRRGGVAANIAYGLGLLGCAPVLLACVGEDFADYRSWLDRHGVDTSQVCVTERAHTARFMCTTDADQCQIASFYPGAMSYARELGLAGVLERVGTPWLVVVSPNDPAAMLRHTAECRERGLAFLADPSQQLASLGGQEVRQLVEGAAYLVTNAYERELLEARTGWTGQQVAARVGVRVTTRGADGVLLEPPEGPAVEVGAVPAERVADPTGVGDAFRAGFLAGRRAGRGLARSAQLGCLLATLALETVGPQEYRVDPATAARRLAGAYGAEAASELAPLLPVPRAAEAGAAGR